MPLETFIDNVVFAFETDRAFRFRWTLIPIMTIAVSLYMGLSGYRKAKAKQDAERATPKAPAMQPDTLIRKPSSPTSPEALTKEELDGKAASGNTGERTTC